MMGKSALAHAGVVVAICAGVAILGCGNGVDESEFARNPGKVPADAPKTAAEYDAKYPVPNAGDKPASRGRGGANVTNP